MNSFQIQRGKHFTGHEESVEQSEGMIFVDELFSGDGEWERVVKVKDILTYLVYQM